MKEGETHVLWREVCMPHFGNKKADFHVVKGGVPDRRESGRCRGLAAGGGFEIVNRVQRFL
jgi:hypothetical protein